MSGADYGDAPPGCSIELLPSERRPGRRGGVAFVVGGGQFAPFLLVAVGGGLDPLGAVCMGVDVAIGLAGVALRRDPELAALWAAGVTVARALADRRCGVT